MVESTTFGQTVLVAGSVSQLGKWDVADAVELSAGDYQSGYPRWFVTVALPAGTVVEYKFLTEDGGGGVTYGMHHF